MSGRPHPALSSEYLMSQHITDLRRRWQVAPPVPAELCRQYAHINPVLLQVLYNRRLTDLAHMQSFLERRYLESDDPFLLADMDRAVARVQQAIAQDELIVVYGDFDADGVTATVLLTEALRGLGLPRRQVRPYIPDRVDEGYGLNVEALRVIRHEMGAALVISVDCGMRSVVEGRAAQEMGLDLIITDHHSIGPQLPPALAVINPRRSDSAYPERRLAGVGIAYKLAQALYQALPDRVGLDLTRLLDLAAIGTVADLAPLLGENRKLVVDGLQVLNQLQRPGLAALAEVSRLQAGGITAESIAFSLGPRINAAGRLAHAYEAARLLAALDLGTARPLAANLEQLNRRRQHLAEEMGRRAEELIQPAAPILIAADDAFLPGIVGLVAGRLTERYYRPSIVIEKGEHESRGSCRSIPEFHITEALDQVRHLLERHGGHAQAAGFTVKNENLEPFVEALTAVAAEQLAGQTLLPTLLIDAELPLHTVDWALYEQLAQLEPTGQENQPAVLLSRNVQVLNYRAVGRDATHLQFEVSDGRTGFKAIAYRRGDLAQAMPARLDLAYTLSVNEWRGRRALELQVKDLRPAE